MLYGAYGKTGRLILDEALRRGHKPLLAGRDGTQLAALGRATGLKTRCVSIEDTAGLRAALSDVVCVLLAAGPYHLTGPAIRRACLDARCSYLDVNGEVEDFSQAMSSDMKARAAGVAIVAGVGYGVVFGECLAAHIKARLPAATSLRLSFATKTVGRSRAATLSTAASLAVGGRDIYRGGLRTRAIASPAWQVTLADGSPMRFAAAPMAELVAAHRSTGIANITTGIPLSRTVAMALRIAGPMLGRILARTASRASTPAAQTPSAPAVQFKKTTSSFMDQAASSDRASPTRSTTSVRCRIDASAPKSFLAS
jgi:saccharopine dehydrogenase (NAD+, L-lysine-forming)